MLIFEQVSIDEIRAHNRELADGYVSFGLDSQLDIDSWV
jgi:hypothetical protein